MTPSITMMGCRIDKLSMEETLGRIEACIRSGKPHQHVVENVDKLVKASRETYRRPYPQLAIAGWRDGYWQGEAEEAQVAEQVRASGADLLFVAIGSPQKEQFLGRWQETMRIPFAIGVGGSFDVASGRVKRAPRWMQRAGLEWFYRFLQEARRMFRPYFIEDMAVIRLLIREAAHMRRH
jgi:N-acetylglucosaminyldiphosphoundecaprenol N-acetyl-beta-D-mannosaminyltransferase